MSEKGTLQLSIDTDSVRRLLLEFPKAARPLDDPSEFASYAHHVEREMGGAINLVKVLQVGREMRCFVNRRLLARLIYQLTSASRLNTRLGCSTYLLPGHLLMLLTTAPAPLQLVLL